MTRRRLTASAHNLSSCSPTSSPPLPSLTARTVAMKLVAALLSAALAVAGPADGAPVASVVDRDAAVPAVLAAGRQVRWRAPRQATSHVMPHVSPSPSPSPHHRHRPRRRPTAPLTSRPGALGGSARGRQLTSTSWTRWGKRVVSMTVSGSVAGCRRLHRVSRHAARLTSASHSMSPQAPGEGTGIGA